MANKVKGQVVLQAGTQRYTLVLDYNALCELEPMAGVGLGEIMTALRGSISAALLRSVLWGALQRHHADRFPADKKGLFAAGDLIQAATVQVARVKILEAVNAAFPVKEAAKPGEEGDPPKALPATKMRRQGGTGTSSSAPGSSTD